MVSAAAENVEREVLLQTNYWPFDASYNVLDWNLYDRRSISIPRVDNQSSIYTFTLDMNSSGPYALTRGIRPNFYSYEISSSTGFYGDIGFYLSLYFISDTGVWENESFPNDMYVTVTDSRGVELKNTIDVEHFVPNTDSNASIGVTTSFTVTVEEPTPYITISLGYSTGYTFTELIFAEGTSSVAIDTIVPSSALIIDRTSEELKELENIVNIIMTQNNINSQYYGDVMNKVDSLYTEVGNLADLQEQAIQQFDDWNIVSSVPGSVQDKVDKADQVIADINSLVKPDPEQIVPDYLPDPEELHDISDILSPFFQNALIVQLCTMVLGFAFVSYVLFGKKG